MKKHIILTNGRSGSNYLAHNLNLHPNVVNIGEVFGSWTFLRKIYILLSIFGVSEQNFISYIYSNIFFFYLAQSYSALSHILRGAPINWKRYSNTFSIGVKEFFIHIDEHPGLQYLLTDRDIKVIYLSRSDLVRRYISLLHMQQTQIVVAHDESNRRIKIRVDVDAMLESLDIMQKEVAQERAWMNKIVQAGHEIFEIHYEEYFASAESITDINQHLFTFLEVDVVPVNNTHRKILTDNYAELIENYEEFCSALQNTPYLIEHTGK